MRRTNLVVLAVTLLCIFICGSAIASPTILSNLLAMSVIQGGPIDDEPIEPYGKIDPRFDLTTVSCYRGTIAGCLEGSREIAIQQKVLIPLGFVGQKPTYVYNLCNDGNSMCIRRGVVALVGGKMAYSEDRGNGPWTKPVAISRTYIADPCQVCTYWSPAIVKVACGGRGILVIVANYPDKPIDDTVPIPSQMTVTSVTFDEAGNVYFTAVTNGQNIGQLYRAYASHRGRWSYEPLGISANAVMCGANRMYTSEPGGGLSSRNPLSLERISCLGVSDAMIGSDPQHLFLGSRDYISVIKR